ncbi:hypothetical protein LUX33_15420 [Actinomadura madurae]|uniref:hypothetical protein n=1 Tax=Actinomadura madurae TaxID=1993 RepID=UPI0020D205B1|nr:hypothetical protein [Actinomadura madurae]MCP9949648.1 hypothetical protein [Actinomadura madurae]
MTDWASSDTSSTGAGTVTRLSVSPPVISVSSALISRTGRSARRIDSDTIQPTAVVASTTDSASRPISRFW